MISGLRDEREKVRVSFVQQSKPQEVILPDEPVIITDTDFAMAVAAIAETNHLATYTRQDSVDSGWDNPFRPGGDLSREADEIVELIKGGKPITPTSATNGSPLPALTDQIDANNTSTPITESPKKAHVAPLQSTPKSTKNGNVQTNNSSNATPAKPDTAVDVQRGTIGQPADVSQVEHVVIKKKPKCKCCVIQ